MLGTRVEHKNYKTLYRLKRINGRFIYLSIIPGQFIKLPLVYTHENRFG